MQPSTQSNVIPMFINLPYPLDDAALEAIMVEEERKSSFPKTLQAHPVFSKLLDSADQLNTSTTGVKMTTPVDHVPEVTIVSLIKSITPFFNPAISADHWQKAVDQHQCTPAIITMLQGALNAGVNPASTTGGFSMGPLNVLMDKLDALGLTCTFNRETLVFSILFSENADVHLDATQRDLKNKPLLDFVNGVDVMENPTGGWIDSRPTMARSHPWTVQLTKPVAAAKKISPWASFHPWY